MVLRKEKYKDMDKFNNTRRKQKLKYYRKTQGYEKRTWTDWETDLVMDSKLTDTELSEKIERSVNAIQTRRCAIRKGGLDEETNIRAEA